MKLSKPLVIAHRGDTKSGLENTLPAIESAIKMGVDGIEVDLQMTRDGRIVLFHDEDLVRLAGRGERIEECPYNLLRTFSIRGAMIPTLEELLDLAQDRVLLNLEIKTVRYFSTTMEGEVIRWLKKFRVWDSILISAFHPLSLWRLKRLAPSLARGYLFENKLAIHQGMIPIVGPKTINAPRSYVTKRLIDKTHRQGRSFFVWTVNDEEEMKKCLELGVDGIITDEPARLMRLIKSSQNYYLTFMGKKERRRRTRVLWDFLKI